MSKLSDLQTALQPYINKIPRPLIAAGVAFGAGAWESFRTADYRPALTDLLAGHVGAAAGDISPAIATAVAAGLTALITLIRTSHPDEKKMALLSSKVAVQAAMIAAPSPISIPPAAVIPVPEPPPVPK